MNPQFPASWAPTKLSQIQLTQLAQQAGAISILNSTRQIRQAKQYTVHIMQQLETELTVTILGGVYSRLVVDAKV